ncbi:ATP-dependent RecD-like DNA helicase [Nocardia cyriacigeorgica]|uniref:ATP-dependent RecD-like DNA helicase n=1 Tax=Nocardia cyriacigeorgica TaxID=135487 RepID=UPI0024581211|nr:ATP-dependent RecD-like DNA helicase [Nocardia cyriacigeorgica]
MRVPWRDRPWDQFVCDDPLGNSSCTLLTGIGKSRDDAFEVAHSGAAVDSLDQGRLPCLSERGMFMSPLGYSVVKQHPFRHNPALRGSLLDSTVSLPGYAFEAVPFRWMNRQSLQDEVGHERVPGFDQNAEDAADAALSYSPPWVMDADNQRAILDAFFEPVVEGDSLVFIYVKHSPLQEERPDRLLVGAARVLRMTPPPKWNQAGTPPFESLMWETIVEHSLRHDMRDGFLLPYQQLIPLLDAGVDIDSALAWAPEGRTVEFSYVTEHLSDDAAIEALTSLQAAGQGMQKLGVDVPDAGLDWLQTQIERLWQLRGPTPGLPGVLRVIGVQQPYVASRAILTECADDLDPWQLLDTVFADPGRAAESLRTHIGPIQARIWNKLPNERRTVLRLLSGMDISPMQIQMLMDGATEVELECEELLSNPYFAATCTYGQPDHIPFTTIDRALFPPTHVRWQPPAREEIELDGHLDRRRIEALLTDVLERQGRAGDTVVPEGEALDLANQVPLAQPPNLTATIISGLDLDNDGIADWEQWSPIRGVSLADGTPAYKLVRFDTVADEIRYWVADQQARDRLGAIPDARGVLDRALSANRTVSDEVDALEDRARAEKAAGLSALHDAPLSVLIGPAGTGKTTLLRALVDHTGLPADRVLLLAPTGKAKVQLETKVGMPAKTLASFLATTDRYDGDTGRYLLWGQDKPRHHYALVIIDEASMLTEEMLAATLDALANVSRLILVGDPRQLPPIGAGRPFVDLVNTLRPKNFDTWIRVAPGYVELQIPRRQLADGRHGRRHDLELAAWFGDNTRGAADDDIWTELATAPDLPTLRYVQWGTRTAVETLTDELDRHLGLSDTADPARAFAQTYGGVVDGEYLNWNVGAGERAEDWQILTPTRSRAFGTVEINRHIKRTYRGGDTAWAQRNARSNIPRPIGPELIVRGDKVMQTTNKRMKAWPKDGAMNYVANGEIGVGIGYVTPARKTPKNKLSLKVEFSSQPGYQYSYWPSDSDDPPLELAWAVTVHKSQGSEFKITFLILPARARVSRELMYTALTRQQDKVVILHEGTLADLRELAHPLRSETARRLTDLFEAPQPVTLDMRGHARRFDRTLMHVSANGIAMASKNEVIISGLLDRLAPGRWAYEQPLTGRDGRVVLPDFTITTGNGRTVYWEHAGMLDLPDYARKWELKKTWYADNGILPHDQGGGPNGTLLWTDDRNGADAQAWLQIAGEVLGTEPAATTDGHGRPGAGLLRRVAKKSVPKRSRLPRG